jgi:hypothetical protein
MRWNTRTKNQLMLAIQRHKRKARYGISCIYMPLSESIGVKIYSSEKIRDKTYEKQAHAANYGLAPIVGDKFSFECFWIGHTCTLPDIRHKIVYGYLTQNAVVKKKGRIHGIGDLRYQLYEIGLVNDDLWNPNVGFIGDRLVCIDFDFCSCRWKRGRKSKDAQRA